MIPIILALYAYFVVKTHALAAAPQPEKILSFHEMSLDKRYGNTFVNDVFKNNILLTLYYMRTNVTPTPTVNWQDVTKPFSYTLTLKPQQVFAFHNNVLPQYKGKVAITTNSDFNSQEGFVSDGYLVGDGVCHLASLINWVARDAKLQVVNPTNHNFAVIPEIPKQYGVAIYDMPGQDSTSALQNLYVTNNFDKTMKFVFTYDGIELKVSAEEQS